MSSPSLHLSDAASLELVYLAQVCLSPCFDHHSLNVSREDCFFVCSPWLVPLDMVKRSSVKAKDKRKGDVTAGMVMLPLVSDFPRDPRRGF